MARLNSDLGESGNVHRQIKAVLFDLGNVLIDFDHSIAAGRISRFTDKRPAEIFNLFFDSGITGMFEEGKIKPREFFLKVKKMISLRLGYNDFVPIWNEIFFLSKKNLQVYKLARSLKKKYRLALLSNINILHLRYLKNNFRIFDAFHYIFASCEMGLRKPDPSIYNKTLKILGFKPGEVFYTDDRYELVKKAQDLGIKSFHFRGVNKLKKDFLSAGVSLIY